MKKWLLGIAIICMTAVVAFAYDLAGQYGNVTSTGTSVFTFYVTDFSLAVVGGSADIRTSQEGGTLSLNGSIPAFTHTYPTAISNWSFTVKNLTVGATVQFAVSGYSN